MKINENLIYIFLLGILAGIICVRCVNHLKKSPKDMYIDNFEYEKESLYIYKKKELKNEDLCVKYLHIHNKALPRLTLIYLEEIRKMW